MSLNDMPGRTLILPEMPENAPERAHEGEGLGIVVPVQAAILGFALVLLFFRKTPLFNTVGVSFVSIVLEAFPFMLLGTLVGGFIEAFLPRDTITRFLPAGSKRGVFIGAGLGLLFPVCECAIVPVVRRLIGKGVPLGAAVAYLLGGPIVNPLVAASTAYAYGGDWRLAGVRLLVGYGVAVCVGFLMGTLFKKGKALCGETDDEECGCASCGCEGGHDVPDGFRAKVRFALGHAADDFYDIGRFLVIGAFIAALMQGLVSRGSVVSLGDAPVLSILIMMLLAVLLNLCSEADAFVAASFQGTPISLTAQMAFMVLGPMLDIKLITMYFRVFTVRAIAVLSSATALTVFLVMLVREVM